MPKISPERKEATRRRLIDAAIEVTIATKRAATTREILAAAGLSAGALYHYFESKEELYAEIARRFVDTDESTGRLDDTTSHEDALAHHRAVITDLFRSPHTLLAHLRASSLESDAVRATFAEIDRGIVERSAANIGVTRTLGLFGDDFDPEVLSELIVVFWEGVVMRDATTGFASDRQALVEQFVSMLADTMLTAAPESAAVRDVLIEATRPSTRAGAVAR